MAAENKMKEHVRSGVCASYHCCATLLLTLLVVSTQATSNTNTMSQNSGERQRKATLTLYFVRHGETVANTLRQVVGQSDSV